MSQTDEANRLFGSLSPSDVVRSTTLLQFVHNFLRRATQNELEKLVPDGYKICKIPTPGKKPLGDQGHISIHMKKTITCLSKTANVSDKEYMAMWNFVSYGDKLQACRTNSSLRILDTMQRIGMLEKNVYLASCALRFSLLFLSHLIEQQTLLVGKEMLQTGVGKKTIVFEQLARQSGEKASMIKERQKRSKNYLLFAQKWGIGSLLVLGSRATILENLSKKDIESLYSNQKTHLPNFQAQCERLNTLAAQLALEGLWKYGWGFEELSKGGKLMELVGQHIDLPLLASGYIELRDQPWSSTGTLGEGDTNIKQLLELLLGKKRKLLSREGCSCTCGESSMGSTTMTENTIAVGIEPLASGTPGAGLGSPGETGEIFALLPKWPPQWATLTVQDQGSCKRPPDLSDDNPGATKRACIRTENAAHVSHDIEGVNSGLAPDLLDIYGARNTTLVLDASMLAPAVDSSSETRSSLASIRNGTPGLTRIPDTVHPLSGPTNGAQRDGVQSSSTPSDMEAAELMLTPAYSSGDTISDHHNGEASVVDAVGPNAKALRGIQRANASSHRANTGMTLSTSGCPRLPSQQLSPPSFPEPIQVLEVNQILDESTIPDRSGIVDITEELPSAYVAHLNMGDGETLSSISLFGL